jgi:thiamine biosynthesis protein ThiC
MKNIAIAIVLLFFATTTSIAQGVSSDTSDIKTVIQKTFSAMETGDSVLLASCFSKEATLQVQVNKNDSVFVSVVPAKDFITKITKAPKGTLHERVVDWKSILIDKQIASVWIPYTFHRGEVFSHRGTDVFHLVKFTEGWKITSLMYNMYQ